MKRFLDSNVFLYAFLNQDVGKKTVAAKILAEAVREDNGYVSLQVAKEFCNVMIKRSGKPYRFNRADAYDEEVGCCGRTRRCG